MLLYLFIGIIIGVVATAFLFLLTGNTKGNLILLEEEDENDTYAFLELHVPINKIKEKKSVRLKIERRKTNSR